MNGAWWACKALSQTPLSHLQSPQELPGFTEEPPESEAKFVTTGFARNAVLVRGGRSRAGGRWMAASGTAWRLVRRAGLPHDCPCMGTNSPSITCLMQGVAGELVKAVQEVGHYGMGLPVS